MRVVPAVIFGRLNINTEEVLELIERVGVELVYTIDCNTLVKFNLVILFAGKSTPTWYTIVINVPGV